MGEIFKSIQDKKTQISPAGLSETSFALEIPGMLYIVLFFLFK